MTTQELSDGFDVLFNQQYYAMFSIQNPVALTEYEKSLFLTEAENNFVEAMYRMGYGIQEGFEKTEYARRILSNLVYSCYGEQAPSLKEKGISEYSQFFFIPDQINYSLGVSIGILGIIYEHAEYGGDDACAAGKIADIIPVKHDDYLRIKRNPFKGPSLRRVLRVDSSGTSQYEEELQSYEKIGGTCVELISKYPIQKYLARVIRRPLPIILVTLPDEENISIEGFKDMMGCELNPAVHKTILEEAVKLALASKTLNTLPVAPQPKENKEKDAGE